MLTRLRLQHPSHRRTRTAAWGVGLLVVAGGPGSGGGTGPVCGRRVASGGDAGGHRLPGRGRPGLAGPAAVFPGPAGHRAAHRAGPHPVAAAGLKKQRARLESTRRTRLRTRAGWRTRRPRPPPRTPRSWPTASPAARDSLFRVGLYLTVHAATERALAHEVAAVRAVAVLCCWSMPSRPPTGRCQGWLATLPFGMDTLQVRRTFDTAALAACFPFTSPDLPPTLDADGAPTGVLYGLNAASGAPVFFDRFAQDNYNSITPGPLRGRQVLPRPSSSCCGCCSPASRPR